MNKTLDRCDLLITGGQVIDGTGCPAITADVAVQGDRIIAVGDLTVEKADAVIDAQGKVITPGFIDVHTHDDRLLLSNSEVTPKLSQGVTTVVVGNCGVSLSPWLSDRARPVSGHATRRGGAMDRLDRPATQAEIEQMRTLLRESLAAGAGGFSTGLFYPPNKAAPAAEVEALARELPAFQGVYATHMRNEGDQLFESLDETFDTARRAGCPVVVSHHKCQSKAVWGRSAESLARIEAAAAEQPVGFDVYPYVAGSTVLLEEMIEPSRRIIVSWSAAVPDAGGRDLADIATEWSCSLAQAMARLQPGGGIYFCMEEEDVERILAHPMGMIGSDGIPHDKHPHPRLWGTFPRVLGHYSRDRQLFPLEEAVRKMTGLSAQTFGLTDRGGLEAGTFADLVVYDRSSISDLATFEQPTLAATGIVCVIVNGVIAWQEGTGTGSRTGRLLKNPRSPEND